MAEGVSVARQLELAKKYGGMTDENIKLIQYEGDDAKKKEERDLLLGTMVVNLANAIIQLTALPNDVEDLSAMVPDRFAVTRADYLMFYGIHQALAQSANNEG